MASKKKKSKQNAVQMVAGVAAMGMPAPVQKLASSKLGSMLLIVGGIAAVATGAITISWQGGKPSVTVNEARAEEIKQRIQSEARVAVERIAEERLQGGMR